jgi:hypothetical protein
MRANVRVLGVVLVLLALGGPAFAQIPGINVHVGARVGVFTPMSALGEDASGRETKVSSGLGVGASIEFDIPLSPINVRANVDAALGRSIEVDGQEVAGTEVDVINLTGDLVFRPLPRIIVLQPYLLAGAGIKKYSTENGFEDRSDFTGHLGIGADLKAGPISVLAEVSDYISSFKATDGAESKLQNDVFVMVGFRIGLL